MRGYHRGRHLRHQRSLQIKRNRREKLKRMAGVEVHSDADSTTGYDGGDRPSELKAGNANSGQAALSLYDPLRIRDPGLSWRIEKELISCHNSLLKERKNRQISSELVPVETLKMYQKMPLTGRFLKKIEPGVLSIDINPYKNIIATGGVDTNVVLFDQPSRKVMATLCGHSDRVTSVKFVGRNDLVITGSADKTVRIWQGSDDGNYNCNHTLKDHRDEVQAVTVHATNKYFVTASLDSTCCFYDISSGSCLTRVRDTSVSQGYTSVAFHPYGLLFGAGTSEALVRIWDIKSQTVVQSLNAHVGAVTSISFSENGNCFATAARDGVKMWDRRNYSAFIWSYCGEPVSCVEFDSSGSYLAAAGTCTRVFGAASLESNWKTIKTFKTFLQEYETGKQTSVKFGPDAKYIAVGSTGENKNLRIFCELEYEVVGGGFRYVPPIPAVMMEVEEETEFEYEDNYEDDTELMVMESDHEDGTEKKKKKKKKKEIEEEETEFEYEDNYEDDTELMVEYEYEYEK